MSYSSITRGKDVPIRGISFFVVLGILFLPLINNLVVDYLLVKIMEVSHIPLWYMVLLSSVNILTILSLIGIYSFRRVGIFLFPFLVILHFIIKLNYLGIFMYTDIFTLFFFIGIGLLVFIPKWSFFR